MGKNGIQDQELGRVSGGFTADTSDRSTCPSCKSQYYLYVSYPEGFKLSEKSGKCMDTVYYFKCPSCGFTWDITY